MSATRSTSIRALRKLSSHSHQTRQLHIIGPARYPAPLAASEKSAKSGSSREIKSSRTEGLKRSLPSGASKDESNPNATTSRNMSTARAPTRPEPLSFSAPQKSTREINTSRTLKAHNDTSTVDFAYFPTESAEAHMDNVHMRVPLIPDNYMPTRTGAHTNPVPTYDGTMRAQVATAAGESTFVSPPSAMSESVDNTSTTVDYAALVDQIEQTATVVNGKAKETQGTVRQLWDGMVEDILGSKKATV